jgi:hypothetical protein
MTKQTSDRDPKDAFRKVTFLCEYALPRRFPGSKTTTVALAEVLDDPRKKDNLNKENDARERCGVASKAGTNNVRRYPRSSVRDWTRKQPVRLPSHFQSALARAFDFSMDWSEWKTGTEEAFRKKYQSVHPDLQPFTPTRRTNARLDKGPRQPATPSKIKGLVAVEIDGSQFGPGTAAIDAMISCGMPIILHAFTTIQSGRIELKCSPAMLTKNALEGWRCKPRSVTGSCGAVHISFEAGTREAPGWRLTADGASIGMVLLDPDFVALEGLAPGDEITLEFGTWLPDIQETNGASADDSLLTADGLVLVGGNGVELAIPEAEVSKRKQRIIACIRKGLLPVDNNGYVGLASHVLKVVEAAS